MGLETLSRLASDADYSGDGDGEDASACQSIFHQGITGDVATPALQLCDHRLGDLHPPGQFRLCEARLLSSIVELFRDGKTLTCLRDARDIGWILKVRLTLRLLFGF